MKVVVYVEGPSDSLAMKELLRPLIQMKLEKRVEIEFYPLSPGRNKHSVLSKAPVKAVNILKASPDSYVFALPDLYPKDVLFPHETPDELLDGLTESFEKLLKEEEGIDFENLRQRFVPFCFKYEMEALILAANDELGALLGVNEFQRDWTVPVEDQNHDEPPKQVVIELFKEVGRKYRETKHAPDILGAANYTDIAERCQQCFKPFVDFLERL